MLFREIALADAWVIEPQLLGDERGWFARTFDAEQFAAHGLCAEIVQSNASFNARRGTVRGMHYQAAPHGEPKLVRCVRGAVFDVAVDLRPDSETYCAWHAVELSADNRLAFYIPAGMAHGYQTLTDDCELHYEMGYPYTPDAARGVRWDDPAFSIRWPPHDGELMISEKDRSYPDYQPQGR